MTAKTMAQRPTAFDDRAETPSERSLPTGGRIEVWNQFLGSWTGEFEVESVADEGVRIRRSTDNSVLPRAFPAHDVRPAP